MYPPGGQRQPEINFDQIIGRFTDGLNKIRQRFGGGGIGIIIIGVIAIIVAIWMGAGVYTVGPGQNAALRLFGAVQGAPVTQE